jgi:uncharacterized phage protein (TIGR02218 family)
LKSSPVALLSHYEESATTVAYGLKITRGDGQVFAFTSHDKDVDGANFSESVTYNSSRGLDVTTIKHTAGLAVGNMQLTTLHDGSLFTTSDVLGGLWRNADYVFFRYNWQRPQDGRDILSTGTLGEVTIGESQISVELRDLRQYLQHPVGEPSQKNCRYRLGDANCGVDLGSPNSFTESRSVSSVTSRQVFTCANLSHGGSPSVENWYRYGEITWTSGNNNGISVMVMSSGTGGLITLAWPMYADIQAGDQFTITAGCDRTLDGVNGCKVKFNNVLNFGGEPHRPGVDDLTQTPTFGV